MPRSAHPQEHTRRATIEDVANAAGVSVATVSRSLRGLPNVAFSTRQRVADAADALSYRADPAAARLATGRGRSIALVVPLLNSWYFSQVVAGAEAVCAEEGYDVMVIGVADAQSRQSLFDATTSIHRRVDGLVFVDIPLSDHEVAFLAEHNLAIATIGGRTDRFPSLGIDDVAVGDMATTHLIELGHTRIGLIAGQPEDVLAFDCPDLRRAGYEQALGRAGIELDTALQIGGNFSVIGGREAMDHLLGLTAPPTAVFAMSDEMAFGVLLAARQAGLVVPRDLSVVGVDDHDVSIVVGLTTIRQQIADHGARAARFVLETLGGVPVEPHRVDSAIELVVRDTTGPPAPATP